MSCISRTLLLIFAFLAPAVAGAQVAPASTSLRMTAEPVKEGDVHVPEGCARVQGSAAPLLTKEPATPSFLPVQLEVRTPVEPVVFPSAGRSYAIYELHLRNLSGEALELQGIEVLDVDPGAPRPVATFGASRLPALFFPRGHGMSEDEADASRRLENGQGTVAYLCLAFDSSVVVPAGLRHRVVLQEGAAMGPAIATHHDGLRTFGPPVAGPDWLAAGGPGNASHHRVGLLVIGGHARISRRHAIDWRQIRDGANYAGDALDVRAYHAYGEVVYAVADGTVTSASAGFPDNIPRTSKGFETSLPLTMENVAGNTVTLDVGDRQFALYAHLAPGSVLVKAGDRVRRGQALGRIGNSGDSREPHLHFEVSDSPHLLAGEGMPYLIDRYELRSADGRVEVRNNELPVQEMRVDFRTADAL